MVTNPTRITFTMPTQRVDGSDLDGTLAANVYMDGVQIVTYPSALNSGETAQMLFADLGWEPTLGQTHAATVTALEDGRESAPSNAVEFRFVGKPNPPQNVALA